MNELTSRHRTKNYIRQISWTALYRLTALFASFIALPIAINYLGQEKFGVWSTLLSVMSWLVFFDLGIGNGLRNKLAESIAAGDFEQGRNYISSAYISIGVITSIIFLIFFAASYYLKWNQIFNIKTVSEFELRLTVQTTAFFISVNFWLGLISYILAAIQKASLVALGQLITNVLALIFICTILKITDGSIFDLALAYGLSLLISNFLMTMWLFKKMPNLIPSFRVKGLIIKPLLALGIQFFTIQLAALVVFTTDKMLITQIFGPMYVTSYDVIFKVFNIVNFGYGIISTSLIAAYTDAYFKSDLRWIKKTLHSQIIVFLVIILIAITMVIYINEIVQMWVGNDFVIPSGLAAACGLFVCISVWNNVFGAVLTGIGKIKIESIYTVFVAILNIPLSYFFAVHLGFGLAGIVIGSTLSIFISSIISPLQVYLYIHRRVESN